METWIFPQYRKFKGIPVWFKINSEKEFVEVKKMGDKLLEQTIKAIQYPEMVRIQDMLICFENRWEVISEADYLLLF